MKGNVRLRAILFDECIVTDNRKKKILKTMFPSMFHVKKNKRSLGNCDIDFTETILNHLWSRGLFLKHFEIVIARL